MAERKEGVDSKLDAGKVVTWVEKVLTPIVCHTPRQVLGTKQIWYPFFYNYSLTENTDI